eukprot:SAG31_NODE_1565_length_7868_cov_27.758914_2_plen_65_part_00
MYLSTYTWYRIQGPAGHPALVGTRDAPDVVLKRIVPVDLNLDLQQASGTVPVLIVLNLKGGYPV